MKGKYFIIKEKKLESWSVNLYLIVFNFQKLAVLLSEWVKNIYWIWSHIKFITIIVKGIHLVLIQVQDLFLDNSLSLFPVP